MENFEIKDGCLISCNITNEVAHIVSKRIKRIGEYAFSFCHELERLYLPWYVEEVPETNFVDRSGVFRKMLQAPGFTIFGEKGTEAEKVALQAGVNFEECTEIVKGDRYFQYLGKEDVVKIPDNIEYIGMGAFCNAPQVKKIDLPQGLKVIDKQAFAGTKISTMVIPASVKNFDSYVFKGCKNLKEVVFENGEVKLDNCCFEDCCKKLIIKAAAGSFVEEYAKKYNIKFETL